MTIHRKAHFSKPSATFSGEYCLTPRDLKYNLGLRFVCKARKGRKEKEDTRQALVSVWPATRQGRRRKTTF
eukprot:scaffold2642_cov120-Cylindrotheca_fusiformis.AAC.9